MRISHAIVIRESDIAFRACWAVSLKIGLISLCVSRKSGPKKLNGKPRKKGFCVSDRRIDKSFSRSRKGNSDLLKKLLLKL